jgi:branched-chain amino acid transport system ATP-binding protein
MTTMANTLLKVSGLKVAYGGIQAVKGVSFEVNLGELVSLIGANGAGKTTTLKAVTGVQPVAAGEIEFMGRSIKGQGAWDLVAQGLVMVPEGRGVFARMTIAENLMMGAFVRRDAEIDRGIEYAFTLFPRLKERAAQKGGTLSGGEQQMLATARGLMSNPRILLMDEPSMGLAPVLVDQIFDVIKEMNSRGTTILLVEQDALMALGIAHRAYVLQTGKIVLSGKAADVARDENVKKAYLGI